MINKLNNLIKGPLNNTEKEIVIKINELVSFLNTTPSATASDYTEKFTYTGSTYTLTAEPNYIYSIRTTTMILDETDSNDVTIVGTTLTVVNPNFLSGETLYIKYKA